MYLCPREFDYHTDSDTLMWGFECINYDPGRCCYEPRIGGFRRVVIKGLDLYAWGGMFHSNGGSQKSGCNAELHPEAHRMGPGNIDRTALMRHDKITGVSIM